MVRYKRASHASKRGSSPLGVTKLYQLLIVYGLRQIAELYT